MIRVRPAVDADLGRVVSDWVRTYRHSVDVRGLTDGEYYPRQKAAIHAALPHMTLTVACPEDETDDTVLGWAARGPNVLHFVVVRQELRGMGVTQLLLPEDVLHNIWFYSHRIKRWHRTPENWRFAPLLFHQPQQVQQ